MKIVLRMSSTFDAIKQRDKFVAFLFTKAIVLIVIVIVIYILECI